MAKCDFCGKGVTFGIKVSHSHRRSNRAWKPNVKRVKAVVNGTPCHVYACTRCLRSNKGERAGYFHSKIKTGLTTCLFAFAQGQKPSKCQNKAVGSNRRLLLISFSAGLSCFPYPSAAGQYLPGA